ncbi:MAG: carboxylesterase family protein [Pseudomonadales bacterium]|nr:carboxylesterase family protein [Halioglobus sp.]MCP5128760.1 carboxylesterase family protein [Pseudomonadales bacterium]
MFAFTRILLITSTFALAACSDNNNNNNHSSEPEVALGTSITTASGPIEGIDSERAQSWIFLGIPYAAAPVGDLRWKAPRPVTSWSDTLSTKALPDFCPQFLYFSNQFAGDEDCLYLNVYRPRTQERDLPVFVWIHGGGNNNGDTGQETPAYDGARLAERGNMVVVTVQYRLGALGWLYLPALHGDNELDNSGNFGTLDIIESLKWVQANAAAFGGDTENVTIAGESAGAANVLTLIISEQASGLFHKAVIQSLGGNVNSTDTAFAQSQALIDDLMAFEGVPDEQLSNEELAAYLRSLDPQLLLGLANASAIIGDGVVIPVEGYELLETGNFPNKTPVLLGTNKDEQKLYTNPLGFNAYPDGPEELRNAVGRYLSDAWRVAGADNLATRLAGLDDMPQVYVYRFNWGSTDENGNSPLPANFGDTGGAFHSSEISFMMGNEDVFIFPAYTSIFFYDENAASRTTMSEVMVSYWSNFAYRGDPNGNSLPIWEPWSNAPAGPKAVTLDVSYADNSPRVEPDPTVYTEETVYAAARANLEGDILAEVLRLLDARFGDW